MYITIINETTYKTFIKSCDKYYLNYMFKEPETDELSICFMSSK
jgi:hypothetical protein